MVHQPGDSNQNNRYRVDQLLGIGARGSTSVGLDRNTNQQIAIKVLDRDYASNPRLTPAFRVGLSNAAQLDHPDILKYIYIDFNPDGVPLYLVTDLIPMGNLRQYALSLGEAIQIARQICLVIDYAHQHQVFHGALKPENILLDQPTPGTSFPRPLLAELGLPAWTEMGLSTIQSVEPRVRRDVLPGTLKYLAPEQVNDQIIDARTDIYALGVILYELAVGQVPFDVKTIAQARRQHAAIPPPLPRSIQPDLPETFEAIILKALAKNPAERYQSAAELAEALAQELSKSPTVFTQKRSPAPPSPKNILPPPVQLNTPSARVTPAFTEVSDDQQQQVLSVDYHVQGFLAVEPGKSVSFSFIITNHTRTTRECNLLVEGIPGEWITLLPVSIRVNPNERREVRFTITPPRAPNSQVGRHTLIIHVRHPDLSGGKLTIGKPLMVGRYTQFECELRPESKRFDAGSTAQVMIRNQGNSSETFLVRWHEATGKLKFTPARERLQIPPGESRTINFKAVPGQALVIGQRPLIQNLERLPIAVAVSLDNQTKTLNGEVVTRGVIPTRFGAQFVILSLILILGLILCRNIPKPVIENVVLTPSEPDLNQPFVVSWVIGGNTWGANIDLSVDQGKIKTGLDIDDEYNFIQGVSKGSILTVHVTNIFGFSDSRNVPVGKDPRIINPDDIYLTVTPQTIYEGEPIWIEWDARNASIVRLDPFGFLEKNEFAGSRQDWPRTSTTYRLTATFSNNESPKVIEKYVEVQSRQAPKVDLMIDPPVITKGQEKSITLSWVSENADTLMIEPGVGEVKPCDPNAAPGCNQRQIPAPTADTTFTITGQNPSLTISKTVQVFVVDAADPIITEFKASPAIVAAGFDRTILLSWNTQRADTVTLTPDIGAVEPSGSREIRSPSSDTSYTLTAENNQGVSTFQTINIKVKKAQPPEITLNVNPTEISITRDQLNKKESLEVIVEWNVDNMENGDPVSLSRAGTVIEEGQFSGSKKDKIPALPGPVTYILTAKNRFSQPLSERVTIMVNLQN